MTFQQKIKRSSALIALPFILFSCKKDDHNNPTSVSSITVQNVLDARPIVESGTYQGAGTPPVILPGQSITIHFSAAKGEAITFASMYG